jgi:AcrR family transcriptional regulator
MGRNKVHNAATADGLLVVAERLVDTEGVDAVTVRRLAEELGTTTRAVYSTYGGKDALLAALGIRAFEVLAAFVRRVALTDDAAADLVQVGAAAFRDFARRHTGLFRVGFDPIATPPQIWSEVRDVNADAWHALLQRVDRLGLEQPTPTLALQFHALCEGLAINELRGNLGTPRAAKAIWKQSLAALIAGWTRSGPPRSSDDVVQRQVDAYSRRDLDGFMACYAPTAVIEWADGSQRIAGHDAIRGRYAELFGRAPDLHAGIAGRLRAGEWTVDEERVRMAGALLHVLVSYHVRDGVIDHVVMLRSD